MKDLVLYVYHEINSNVLFFLEKGIFKDDNTDFIFINNGCKEKLNLPEYILYFERENIGFDFGAWSDVLLTNDFYKKYDRFMFVNSSVLGPFIPQYYNDKWVNIFWNGLKNNVKLFGCTINNGNIFGKVNGTHNSHVQSMVFCLEFQTLVFLIEKGVFTKNYYSDKDKLIIDCEIGQSQFIIKNGWNIGCLMKHYQDYDFVDLNKNKHVKLLGDIQYEKAYFGNTIHPYEVIFLKTNRIKIDTWLTNYTN
jgi:hypothetical protein